MTIEEIENGVHANRLRLLVELLRSQTEPDGPQVFATTHSPTALAWIQEEEYRTTFFCKREESTGESTIPPAGRCPALSGRRQAAPHLRTASRKAGWNLAP